MPSWAGRAALGRRAALTLAVLAGACAARRPAAPPAEPAIVVAHLGDSTVATPYLPPSARVDALLNARLADHYRAQQVVDVNVARARETVRALLDGPRWAIVRGRLPRVDVALVRYGQNDMGRRSPEEFRGDLEALCERLEGEYAGVHLVLETNTFIDLAHGGTPARNARYDRYWDVVRALARARGYPLVDLYARRRREAEAGNWDLSVRNPDLARPRFGAPVLDDAHDAEMAGVAGWLGDVHPNARGVAVAADEELRVLTATWPEQLPSAGTRPAQSPYLSILR